MQNDSQAHVQSDENNKNGFYGDRIAIKSFLTDRRRVRTLLYSVSIRARSLRNFFFANKNIRTR